eukprot:CAMPEP_0168472922 /NCGR_PEP_ID=MMETSP0228-20121227/60052_1 /TAXON_ID=133427 /ORGANISM="Protoceratium reticulatum, Strain CCCM 535 (=CCMP 1889)" /LENGTH=41 /DNA_ID= /DNA_START= /DNA_END= /DNA_ORIENTATION=
MTARLKDLLPKRQNVHGLGSAASPWQMALTASFGHTWFRSA